MKGKTMKALRFWIMIGALCLGSCVLFQPKLTKEEKQKENLIETKVLLAQNKLEQARPQAALLELRSLDHKHPNHPMILNMLGLVHLSLGNNTMALEMLERAHKLAPEKVAYGLNLSSVYLTLGQTKEARSLLLRLSELGTYSYRERLLHNIAYTYEMEGNLEQAQEFYEEALVENPVYYLSKVSLAKVLQKQGNLKEAFKTYQKAAQFCPTCYEAREKLVYFYAPRYPEKAKKILDSFLSIQEISPGDREKALALRRKL